MTSKDKEFVAAINAWNSDPKATINLISEKYANSIGIGVAVTTDDDFNRFTIRLKDRTVIHRQLEQCLFGGSERDGRIWARSKPKGNDGDDVFHFLKVR
jgi:hypothetical protein